MYYDGSDAENKVIFCVHKHKKKKCTGINHKIFYMEVEE